MTADRPFVDAMEIAALIDHTLLKPEATEDDIAEVCRQALEYKFASVCVNPYWVPAVHSHLNGSSVRACSVIGFPLGANKTIIKVAEAQLAVREGASEIDMVINVGALRSGAEILPELKELTSAVHASGAILKVILETCLLTEAQKVLACEAAKEAGADFVKTSTGFSTAGATETDVILMRGIVGAAMGVKASGGVRTLAALTRMVAAGANRIGSSSGVQILAEFKASREGAVPAQSGSGDGCTY